MPSVHEVFSLVIEHDPAERRAALDSLVGEDTDLRTEVLSLLNAWSESDGFLSTRGDDPPMALLSRDGGRVEEGTLIGPYRLKALLGEGGMGVVFRAERDDGQFRQTVALKLIRLLSPDAGARRRFLVERQLLARLEHPHIARLLDGGIDPWGRPYLVMELIEGLPILEACRRLGLDLHTRLRMFLDVCGAVAYAHRQLVIHRDLKPANVLVTPAGIPKLLDFGVARALDASLYPDPGGLTGAGLSPFTPQYAAPEQVSGAPATVTTDVYSLGVILFELLTGTLPYDLSRASLAEMTDIICHRDSPPPSSVRHLPSAETPVEVGWAPDLRGDLDAIVLKTLRKAPDHRYPTVEALAMDLQRYLSREPVLARAGGRRYRLERFVSRNRLAVGAVAAVALSLIGGTGLSVWQAHQAREAAARATQVQQLLTQVFTATDPDATAGKVLTAADFLDQGSARAAQILAHQPRVRAELEVVLGGLYTSLGHHDRAVAQYSDAVAGLEEGEAEPAQIAEALKGLGHAQLEISAYDEAEKTLLRAYTLQEQLTGPSSVEVAAIGSLLGELCTRVGRYDEGGVWLDRSVKTLRAFPGVSPLTLAEALNSLAVHRVYQGAFDEGEALMAEVLALRTAELGPDHSLLAATLSRMGVMLTMQGEPRRARPYLERALEQQRRILGIKHPSTLETELALVSVLNGVGAYEEADRGATALYPVVQEVMGIDHLQTALLELSIAAVRFNLRRYEAAAQILTEGRTHLQSKVAADHPYLGMAGFQMAGIALELGDITRAGMELDGAEAILTKTLPPDHPVWGDYRLYRGRWFLAKGQLTEAEETLTRGVALLTEQSVVDGSREVLQLWLARTFIQEGRTREGVLLLQQILPALEAAYGPTSKDVSDAKEGLVLAARAQGGF